MEKLKLGKEIAQVFVVDKTGKIIGRGSKRHKIMVPPSNKNWGIVIDDGREVHKNKEGKWCYQPK
jgi:hypothetical protein